MPTIVQERLVPTIVLERPVQKMEELAGQVAEKWEPDRRSGGQSLSSGGHYSRPPVSG